jgi:hypothetical protein
MARISDALGLLGEDDQPSISALAAQIAPLSRTLGYDEKSVEYAVVSSLVWQLYAEVDTLPFEIIGHDPELYSEYDRLTSEADLRLSLVTPVFAIVILLSIYASILWLCLLPLLSVFYRSGIRRRKEAGEFIADALSAGRVEAPIIRGIRSATQERFKPRRPKAQRRRAGREGQKRGFSNQATPR